MTIAILKADIAGVTGASGSADVVTRDGRARRQSGPRPSAQGSILLAELL
jgi:hypothetical protein